MELRYLVYIKGFFIDRYKRRVGIIVFILWVCKIVYKMVIKIVWDDKESLFFSWGFFFLENIIGLVVVIIFVGELEEWGIKEVKLFVLIIIFKIVFK